MYRQVYAQVDALAREKYSVNDTVEYLAQHLRLFLHQEERALICFPKRSPGGVGELMEQAVLEVGGKAMWWGPDFRWKTLLRTAFSFKITTIIAPPNVVLGLSKLAKATGTPLYIENVLLAGYPCLDWMIDGIMRGLDCNVWGCYGPGTGAMIGGFSCAHSRGVHLREDVYSAEIVDENGNVVPDGCIGEVIVFPKAEPQLRLLTLECGRLEKEPCTCGCTAARLMDLGPGRNVDPILAELAQELLSWTSILDCSLKKGEYGVEMELVTFPGEKLPKLPSCARQVVRNWEPDKDEPIMILPGWKKYDISFGND